MPWGTGRTLNRDGWTIRWKMAGLNDGKKDGKMEKMKHRLSVSGPMYVGRRGVEM